VSLALLVVLLILTLTGSAFAVGWIMHEEHDRER
jgi:hypothetical protein